MASKADKLAFWRLIFKKLILGKMQHEPAKIELQNLSLLQIGMNLAITYTNLWEVVVFLLTYSIWRHYNPTVKTNENKSYSLLY